MGKSDDQIIHGHENPERLIASWRRLPRPRHILCFPVRPLICLLAGWITVIWIGDAQCGVAMFAARKIGLLNEISRLEAQGNTAQAKKLLREYDSIERAEAGAIRRAPPRFEGEEPPDIERAPPSSNGGNRSQSNRSKPKPKPKARQAETKDKTTVSSTLPAKTPASTARHTMKQTPPVVAVGTPAPKQTQPASAVGIPAPKQIQPASAVGIPAPAPPIDIGQPPAKLTEAMDSRSPPSIPTVANLIEQSHLGGTELFNRQFAWLSTEYECH